MIVVLVVMFVGCGVPGQLAVDTLLPLFHGVWAAGLIMSSSVNSVVLKPCSPWGRGLASASSIANLDSRLVRLVIAAMLTTTSSALLSFFFFLSVE